MGQRALVCYQDETGRWSAHYSHWGGLRLALAEHLEGGLKAGGTVEQELPTVPVAGARLEVRAVPDVEDVDRETIVEEVLSWGGHDALYFVPTVGEVEAYLAPDVGRLHSGHEPAQTGALVTPRRLGDRYLTTHVSARWGGWRDVLGRQHRQGQLDEADVLDELNALAFEMWGKAPRHGTIPDLSPHGSTPVPGAVNVTALLANHERRLTDPDR